MAFLNIGQVVVQIIKQIYYEKRSFNLSSNSPSHILFSNQKRFFNFPKKR